MSENTQIYDLYDLAGRAHSLQTLNEEVES